VGVTYNGLFDFEPPRYLLPNDDLRLDEKDVHLNRPIILSPQVKAPFPHKPLTELMLEHMALAE
jgi:hypothetical protein